MPGVPKETHRTLLREQKQLGSNNQILEGYSPACGVELCYNVTAGPMTPLVASEVTYNFGDLVKSCRIWHG